MKKYHLFYTVVRDNEVIILDAQNADDAITEAADFLADLKSDGKKISNAYIVYGTEDGVAEWEGVELIYDFPRDIDE